MGELAVRAALHVVHDEQVTWRLVPGDATLDVGDELAGADVIVAGQGHDGAAAVLLE